MKMDHVRPELPDHLPRPRMQRIGNTDKTACFNQCRNAQHSGLFDVLVVGGSDHQHLVSELLQTFSQAIYRDRDTADEGQIGIGEHHHLERAAKVEGDTIVLGSAISFTGKYSTNGIHAKNGYNLGVKRINETGGVRVGGKAYRLKIIYYDDESTPLRTAQLAERLIKQDGVKFMLGPYSSATTKAIAPS